MMNPKFYDRKATATRAGRKFARDNDLPIEDFETVWCQHGFYVAAHNVPEAIEDAVHEAGFEVVDHGGGHFAVYAQRVTTYMEEGMSLSAAQRQCVIDGWGYGRQAFKRAAYAMGHNGRSATVQYHKAIHR